MNQLLEFNESDIQDYLSELSDSDKKFLIQLSGTGYKFPITKEQVLSDLNNSTIKLFKFINLTNNKIIGYCSLTRINWDLKSTSIGRVLITKNFRNSGLSFKMLKQLIDITKNKLDLSNVSLRVFDYNIPAIKCYKKLGFIELKREDIFYESINETLCCLTMELKETYI